ncbi:Nicotinamidase-related amidase [Nitrosomonas cryotolerans]|uniref:Nicotinamidase-related amidase n=1 Tax=Nitrosomonas cryotolerans ATCC 49181 TaxID=1131553 RepID=A0A1N6FD83_9PROT|nr:cysteine hydrolase family protein [Nitrosomonas cryotolerans]SFQ00789.1 Nicotinamidase-related amidase [Nitrosomonas cryotolerans]SIN93238.1 Nicotinamidase-related amidase [Nitrosomonas cryotolerans ATCC 49181]
MLKTALLLIGFQNDYFQDGKWLLGGMEKAVKQGEKLLAVFRENGLPVVHIRHEYAIDSPPFFLPSSRCAEIHASMMPQDGECVIQSHQVNSLRDTGLKDFLDRAGIENTIIAGAVSHVCVDALTRAAHDFGYNCSVAHDACATLDVEFNGNVIPADQVHAAFMAALGFACAQVTSTEELLDKLVYLEDERKLLDELF